MRIFQFQSVCAGVSIFAIRLSPICTAEPQRVHAILITHISPFNTAPAVPLHHAAGNVFTLAL